MIMHGIRGCTALLPSVKGLTNLSCRVQVHASNALFAAFDEALARIVVAEIGGFL
jgi:hypothetical protein